MGAMVQSRSSPQIESQDDQSDLRVSLTAAETESCSARPSSLTDAARTGNRVSDPLFLPGRFCPLHRTVRRVHQPLARRAG